MFVFACALMLVDANIIMLNQNGCPVSANYEKLLPHENCNQFYQCVNGRLVALECPIGLLYNEKISSCDWPKNVICKNTLQMGVETQYRKNNNPSEAPQICAAAGSDGVLIAHENCNQFYKCSNGLPVPLQCPLNLLYNSTLEYCDWPENVKCGDRIIPNDSDDEDHDNESGDNNENHDSEEQNSHTNCDTSEAPTICSKPDSNGVLIAHEICNQFYKCSGGEPVSLSCPFGLLYNSKREQCDWPDNVNCGARLILEIDSNEGSGNENDGTTNCDPSEAPAICAKKDSDGVLIANENCDQFYKCSEGHPVALNCPSGLLYDSKKEKCDWAQNVICGGRVIRVQEDKPGNYDPSQASDICANADSDRVLVAHEKCDYFYSCASGIPVALQCPNSLFFNPRKNICDWQNNVDCGLRIIPDENDISNEDNDVSKKYTNNIYVSVASDICAKEESNSILVAHEKCNHFYECMHGKPVAFKCPANLLYNTKEQLCDWPKNVECRNRILPDEKDDEDKEDKEQEDEHKQHEGYSDPSKAPYICAKENSDSILIAHEKCNQYYMCWFGYPHTFECPESLLYNPVFGYCDWKANVECNSRIV